MVTFFCFRTKFFWGGAKVPEGGKLLEEGAPPAPSPVEERQDAPGIHSYCGSLMVKGAKITSPLL